MSSKGIWVSKDILHNKNLTANEKLILSEIENLCSLEHGCYASNNHFSELIGITKANASRTIGNLTEKGYISCTIKMGTRNRERIIILITTYPQNDKTVPSKRQETKENKQINKHRTNTRYEFTLKRKCSYDNLSEEYKEKLYGACMLVDGKEDRYDDFIISLRSNGYQYKNFPLAYMNWDKERAYKNFTTEPEPKLGDDWHRVIIGNGDVIAVNITTYEVKRGVVS